MFTRLVGSSCRMYKLINCHKNVFFWLRLNFQRQPSLKQNILLKILKIFSKEVKKVKTEKKCNQIVLLGS